MKLQPAVLLIVVGALACAHTPSVEDRKLAEGSYQAAVALVSEAEEAGARGDVAVRDLKYRESLKDLLDAQKADPDNTDVRYLLGVVYFSGFRRHPDAAKELTAAIAGRAARGEEYPEAENLLGVVLVDQGRPRDALPHFEKARTNLLYATPYFAEQEMGWAYFKLGQHDEARMHLKNAIAVQPDLCGAYVKLAEVEDARADEGAVQGALSEFLERCDNERLRGKVGPRLLSWAFFRLGMSRIKTGARDAGIDALRQCTARFPKEPVSAECDKSLRALDAPPAPPVEQGT
jgi:type IV pilus assembly protein PilF